MTVAGALFISTLFGMGLALFLEYLDDTIRTTEEIESLLQLPALAAIPTIDSMPRRRLLLVGAGDSDEDAKSTSELLISNDSRSSLAEAYRQLRTSILLSTAGHAPKSLLITSSLPSEGKTTTATNTAISLAQTGAKVLLIDADMRRPRMHSVFNIENGVGLSTLLSSETSEAEALNAIKFDPTTKLNLLTSGPIPPNPAELIGSDRTVDEIREHIGATSLAYLSLEGLEESTLRPASQLCRACLTGDYPTDVPVDATKLKFELPLEVLRTSSG